jgi:hypothetical protein
MKPARSLVQTDVRGAPGRLHGIDIHVRCSRISRAAVLGAASLLGVRFLPATRAAGSTCVTARRTGMAEVAYYVALPFVAADDCVAAGEAVECFNPNAAVMRAEALSRKPGHVGPRL